MAPLLPTMHLTLSPPPPLPHARRSDQQRPRGSVLPPPCRTLQDPIRSVAQATVGRTDRWGISAETREGRGRAESRGADATAARGTLGKQGARSPREEAGESRDSGFPLEPQAEGIERGAMNTGNAGFDWRSSRRLEQTDSDASTAIRHSARRKWETWPARHKGVGRAGGGERLRATRLEMRAPSERGTPAAAHANHDPCRRARVADSHAGQTGTTWDRLGPQQKPSGMPLRAQNPRSGGRARVEGRRGRWPSHAASNSMLARARLARTSSLTWTRLTSRRGREKRPQVRSPGLCCAVGVYIK